MSIKYLTFVSFFMEVLFLMKQTLSISILSVYRGIKEDSWLWPDVREIFFEDLKRLHGYAVGRILLSGKRWKLTFWPRLCRIIQ